jgi:uroporphyrinogen-III synthase
MFVDLTPYNQLPLYGKKILVTAPRNYAKRLSEQIINYGGLPILMPTIETCFLEDYTELDTALKEINKFDWIAFTSRNGIDGFFHRLQSLNIPLSTLNNRKTENIKPENVKLQNVKLQNLKLQNIKLCAIGKDAERLQEYSGRVDLIPKEASPQGIINELSQIPNIQKQRILTPVPLVKDIPEPNIVPNFIQGLKTLGMEVTRVPSYITRPLPKDIYEGEIELLNSNYIDIIAFSSAAEIVSFLKILDMTGKDNLVIACFGPYTAETAKSLGLKVSICSENFSSFQDFVEAMAHMSLSASK